MEFKEELKQKTALTEAIIAKYLPAEEGYQKTVLEAMNYSVLAGGKRLRPLLMMETYRLFGGESECIEPFMAAMEMTHTSSLVHDDLPAMDNDQYRRGKYTTWYKYGDDMGILAGDGLMIYTYETACKALKLTDDPVMIKRIARCIELLAIKTGIYGMIGGQTLDVELTSRPMDADQLDFIYRLKTGALLECSLMIGAVLAGASDEEVKAVEAVAADVGMAFQIQDDILDIVSTQEELGKPIGSDEKNQKTTYVTLYGMEAARAEVKRLSEHAVELLDKLPEKDGFLKQLLLSLADRKK